MLDPGIGGAFDGRPAERGRGTPAPEAGSVRNPSGRGWGDGGARLSIPPSGDGGAIESGSVTGFGSDPFGGRPNPFGKPVERGDAGDVVAPPPRPAPAHGRLGGGFRPDDLPPPTEAFPTGPPPTGDARVHALLVSLGWIAALAAGGLGGYLLGLNRGAERRRRSLEPRQLDLAGEVAETADSLMAAAAAGEAGRFEACVNRLRERVGRTAVLLDDRAAGAVRDLVAAATTAPPAESGRDRQLETAYDGLVAALRRSVRGG